MAEKLRDRIAGQETKDSRDGITEERNLGIKEGGPFGKPKGVVENKTQRENRRARKK